MPILLLLMLFVSIAFTGANEDYEDIITVVAGDGPYGTCDQTFRIGKNTVATSDSKRDYANGYNIFPFIHDQDTTHFIEGYCANGCKLELPDTCFKIHMPETFQHDPGLLAVDILEKKVTKKWTSVMSPLYPQHYDAFFDFNFAYWVQSLDDYIEKWNEYNHKKASSASKLEFFGIEWIYNLKDDDGNAINLEADESFIGNTFYSLLIHSPQSQVIYEFISYTKPSNDNYRSVAWIRSNIPRVTFKSMSDPYPWNRADRAYIVPVRKSRATSNLDIVYTFYVDIMEATTSYYTQTYIVDDLGGDNVPTRAVTVVLPDSHIELQFIERPRQYTAGEFMLMEYEALLRETHDSIVTSPFCGLDRWADNHYGYSSWNVEGLLERVLSKLTGYGLKYRIYKSTIEHTSEGGKSTLKAYNKTEAYMAFVFEPTGQTIQMGGDLTDEEFTQQIPIWSAQWCYRKCLHSEKDGIVNPAHVYVDTEDYDVRMLNVLSMNQENGTNNRTVFHLGFAFIALICFGFCALSMCGIWCFYNECKEKECEYNQVIDDCSPLIKKQCECVYGI